jgi:hypothetical protein
VGMKKPHMPRYDPYPSDADEVGSFVAPYLALNREDSKHRCYELREVFIAVRWLVKQSGDLCCCLAAGWWSAVLPGPLVFDGWRATMSVWPKPLPASITLPSLV